MFTRTLMIHFTHHHLHPHQTLVDVVAKGGNLLLDVGPDEHGQLPAPAVEQLELVGEWLGTHGVGVFGTEPVWPYVFNLTSTSINTTQVLFPSHGIVLVSCVEVLSHAIPRVVLCIRI